MAQTKKNTNQKKSNSQKSNSKRSSKAQASLFDAQHKKTTALVFLFTSLFMLSVVFIDAGGLWGLLRNFLFGLFGLNAFVIPFFMCFASVMALMGNDTKEYKHKFIEGTVIFVLLISFCHVVNCDSAQTYKEQISTAYNTYKSYDGTGMHYGYGVLGALLGGISLMLTGGSKLASGLMVALLLIALFILFAGPTLIKLISSLKGPAEAVGEYAEEKIKDLKSTYEIMNEDAQAKRAKNAEKRRINAEKRTLNLDVPIDGYSDGDGDDEDDIILNTSLNKGSQGEKIELLEDFEDKAISNPALFENDFADNTPITQENIVEDIPEIVKTEDEIAEELAEEYADEPVTQEAPPVPEKIYELPPLDCLNPPKHNSRSNNDAELRSRGETIVKTLRSFGVGTKIVEICQSPSVTRFELQPEPGVKISKITALADDIAMNLAASGVRIEAPIPNKNAVGIEVPNAEKAMVTLREILESSNFKNSKSKLNVALGRDIQGESTCADLAKMPHLLVAGTTGSGKSVCLNTMIISLLYNAKPDEVKLIMIDPKKVEFTVYRSIPHLLVPVVADPRKAAGALSWAVAEMDKRYALFADKGVRNLQGYNTYAESENLPKMPQIVIIIDELSDLMMAASNEVEDSICRLAQKARAAGMHLIVATQRPSVDVITGLIKANIPSRIAFAVKSQIDSRTIIDTQGAEKLLGNGDMLYCPVGLSKPVRVQGSYVSDDEIENVVDFVKSQGEVKYDDAVMQEIELKAAQEGKKKNSAVEVEAEAGDYEDEMFPKAVEVVIETGSASTTLLQRKLKLGYARAARVMDELAEKGIIGPYEGNKPRAILITKEQWYQMQALSSSNAPKQLSVDDIAPKNPEVAVINTDKGDEPNYFGSAVNTNNYTVEEE